MKKVNKKKGFTLAELLVVIAILAILIAIAVPIFTGVLDDAETTVKEANLRAAKSAAMVDYLTDDTITDKSTQMGYKYTVDETTHEVTVTKDASVTTEGATSKLAGTVVVNKH